MEHPEKNLIFTTFVSNPKADGSQNLMHRESSFQMYFRNMAVALVSAKHYNRDSSVALATSVPEDEIPSEFLQICRKNQILILHIPFDDFTFPDSYTWTLSFYRACALKHLLKMDYERFCCLDADVYVQGSFDSIWKECDQHLLLFDINHGLNVPDYQRFMEEVKSWYGEERYAVQYGGEFVAGNREACRVFNEKCHEVYAQMIERGVRVSTGDEFMYGIAAYECGSLIKNAGGYVYRFWTRTFRLVATSYRYNKVTVLHLPSEKERGLLKLYRRYISRGKLPSEKTVWRTCFLLHSSLRDCLGRLYLKLSHHD